MFGLGNPYNKLLFATGILGKLESPAFGGIPGFGAMKFGQLGSTPSNQTQLTPGALSTRRGTKGLNCLWREAWTAQVLRHKLLTKTRKIQMVHGSPNDALIEKEHHLNQASIFVMQIWFKRFGTIFQVTLQETDISPPFGKGKSSSQPVWEGKC